MLWPVVVQRFLNDTFNLEAQHKPTHIVSGRVMNNVYYVYCCWMKYTRPVSDLCIFQGRGHRPASHWDTKRGGERQKRESHIANWVWGRMWIKNQYVQHSCCSKDWADPAQRRKLSRGLSSRGRGRSCSLIKISSYLGRATQKRRLTLFALSLSLGCRYSRRPYLPGRFPPPPATTALKGH